MTTHELRDDSTLHYWRAVRGAACAVCPDAGADGSCGLQDRLCAVAAQLPLVVSAILRVRSGRMEDYFQAIEDGVCPRCHESDAFGQCGGRYRGGCALYAHLPLIVEAIEKVQRA